MYTVRVIDNLYADTDPSTERILIGLLCDAPEWRRIEIMCGMIETLRQLVFGGVHQRHPNASEAEVRRLAADVLLGPEMAEKAYGAWVSGGTS